MKGQKDMMTDFYKAVCALCLTLLFVPVFNNYCLDYAMNPELVKPETTASVQQPQPVQVASGDDTVENYVRKVRYLAKVCPSLGDEGEVNSNSYDISLAVHEASLNHNVSPDLVIAMIAAESRCDRYATSRAGAMGLMQLMPRTAHAMGVDRPYSVRQNIRGGVQYMAKLLDRFDGDIKLALAAYNSGPEMVARYRGIPPFVETKKYVNKVLKYRRLLEEEA